LSSLNRSRLTAQAVNRTKRAEMAIHLGKILNSKLGKSLKSFIYSSDNVATSLFNMLNLVFIFIIFSSVIIFLILFFDQNINLSGAKSPEYLRKLSDYAIKFFGLSPEDRNSSLSIIINSLAAFIGIFSAIIPFSIYLVNKASLRKALAEIRSQNPFSSHPIESPQEDFEVMSKYYENARRVYVFSGDFDWLKNNQIIKPTIDRLVSEDRIHFVSSRTPETVKQAVSLQIYDQIKDKMSFSNKHDLRGSMITYVGGSRTFIYRYKEPNEGKDRICSIKDFGEGRFLLSAISRISPDNISGKKIVFLSGYPGSGKTFASSILTRYGFKRISAGEFFREILRSKGLPETRENLNDEGIRYLKINGEDGFAREMINRIDGADKVIFDGIRPIATIEYIKEKFSDSRVVFIDASETTRERRLLARGLTRSEVNFIRSAPIEVHIHQTRAIANIEIKNESDDSSQLEIALIRGLA
jgi:dephospho-CoA kinase